MLGYPKETAPFLASLAGDGVVFEHAHSTSSWTAPATASLFTSLLPIQHQLTTGLRVSKALEQEVQKLPPEVETLPELFARNGYRTFGVTDNLNISNRQGFERGFDRFRSHQYKGAPTVNAKLLEWKEEIDAAERAFVYLHYMDPHEPYQVREPWFVGDASTGHNTRAAYESEISYVDDHIARLFHEMGWGDDVLVVLTSDHGEEFHEHGAEGHGTALYGETLNVPFVVSWPAVLGPRRVTGRVSTLDLLPTLRGLLGLTSEAQHEGRDLSSVLVGAEPEARPLYAHLSQTHPQLVRAGDELLLRALIEEDWKLILSGHAEPELYQLRDDPRETKNLASEQPDRLQALRSRLEALEANARRFEATRETTSLTEEEREHLQDIGYGE